MMSATRTDSVQFETNTGAEDGFTALHYDDRNLRRSNHGDEEAKRDFFSKAEENISQRLADVRESLGITD
jgi:hypothetical protein